MDPDRRWRTSAPWRRSCRCCERRSATISLGSVSFRHERPADDQPHREYFRCEVRFGSDVDGLVFDSGQLERRTLLADEGLSAYLLSQLDELRSQAADRSLVTTVRGVIADSLADGQPSKSQVARRLGMSERTLHRRLADEGESFQTLVTRARQDAAESLLRSGRHSLVDVAFLTGFSDQTAFTRAFKRWTGLTPSEFRDRATAGPA
ncbi:MAG: helix-turn-helix domain-containing protein [Ilumatobacteraceae bacterium]